MGRISQSRASWSLVVAAFTSGAFGREAGATPMRYTYGGTITSADPSTGVAPGTRFSGTFTYDPAVRPPGIIIEGCNEYSYGLGPYLGSVPDGSGITFQVGDRTVLSNPGGVSLYVSESEYPGQYGYQNANGPAGPYTRINITNSDIGYQNGPIVNLGLDNDTRSVFGSLAPPALLKLDDFPVATLNVIELTNPGERTLYTGTIDTLTVEPVPEPAVTTLLCLAAIGFVALRRRQQMRMGC